MPNTYSQIYLHYVFSPKYRKGLINVEFEKELFKYITGIVKNLDQNLIKINGMPDHIHLLVRLRPSLAPSKFIQTVKTNSSRWITENKLIKGKFSWQTGGGIFSVSHRNVPDLIRYIENQKDHHKKQRFKEEYLNLLSKSGITFNNEYLLDFFNSNISFLWNSFYWFRQSRVCNSGKKIYCLLQLNNDKARISIP